MKKLILIVLLFLTNISVFSQELIDKLPFKLVDNLIFFKLHINNSKEPLNFMFDSGAGVTVIDTKIANRLKLNISATTRIGTSGKTIETKESSLNKLKFSKNFKTDDISLFLMDLSHISKHLKVNVDGIIGYDLLKLAIVETNIDLMEIQLFKEANYKYKGNAKSLKLIDLESNHFGLPIEIIPKGSEKSITLIVKIDTGAPNYLTFHNNAVIKHNLIKPKKKYKIRKGFGADATITSNLKGKISSAKFASVEWKNIPAIFEVDPLNKNSKRKADGLIGQQMLLDFNITYLLNTKTIYLEKRK
ncbi:retropepsin-like aspartic protease [Polaribacter sargassicola]|uniref:retropepsin-like aspartic protease n=1 Tax=Polaribacter sargassicola TaxID=2836891 RepID=UPI001F48FE7A|nr:retropepsin-like aspartic protease [Polaribacter sp. DS7-9]MCG1036970.1 retroviral-like aspartic protease family protein [Polaribacter sp. DS7-9]